MMRKTRLLLLFAAAFLSYLYFSFFSAATGFSGSGKYLYIPSQGATKELVLERLTSDSIFRSVGNFSLIAGVAGYFSHILPGRYYIPKGSSLFTITRLLRSGRQSPVKLVINKARMPQDLARLMAKNFEADSVSLMRALSDSSPNLARNKVYKIIPNTYSILWTQPAEKIVARLNSEYDKWWGQNDRLAKAAHLGYTPEQVYILASIVEEETNLPQDKGNIASVYLNRLKTGMPLQADPTIRYALGDFTLNRIMYGHLKTVSPYNTYLNKGLPPGPICTPGPNTIEAVLNAPQTDFLYFVANPDLMGGSTFTTNLDDHNKAARRYQDSLTAFLLRKAKKEAAKNTPHEKAE